MKLENNTNADFCVCCGEPVPEGRMVCFFCENQPIPNTTPIPDKSALILKKLFGMSKERKNEPRT